MKIGVFMIVKNAQRTIERSLESVSFADEVVVVDSGSSDETAAIARGCGAKVIERPFTDYADQKNFALSQCTAEWLLSLDSDEYVTDELRSFIKQTAIDNPDNKAFRIKRSSLVFGRRMKFTGTQSDKPTRLFKRGDARFFGKIHEVLQTGSKVYDARGILIHDTYPDIASYLERFNRYTDMEASSKKEAMPKPGVGIGVLSFLRLYVFKLGFLDGKAGLSFSILSAWYVIVKRCKAWEGACKK